MSFGNQNNNQNTNWNNDPNSFSNTAGGRDFDNFNDDNFNVNNPDSAFQGGNVRSSGYSGSGPGGRQGYGDQGPRDALSGNTTDINTHGAGAPRHHLAGTGRERGAYDGNTTDVDTMGAGGDFTGRDTGRLGDQDWNTASTGEHAYSGNTTDANTTGAGTGGKTSMGDRVKGTMEKMTGKLTGNPNMAGRGQERKEGDLNRDY